MYARTRFTVILVLGLGLPHLTQAAVLQVPADFADIQAAIEQASNGDVIEVAPGVYPGAIDFLGKAIRIESLAGPEQTLIDGLGQPGYVVTFQSGEGRDSVLAGFTITGGFGQLGSMGAGPGGGVAINQASPTLEGNIITANLGGLGGGLHLADGDPLLRQNRIEANEAGFGGGIYVEGGRLTLEGGQILDNLATTSGGGIGVTWADSLELSDLTLSGNVSHSLGGALWLNNTVLQATGLNIYDNGLVSFGSGGSISLQPLGGGAIYAANTSGRLERTRLNGNAAFAGSALYLAGQASLEVVNVLASANHAAQGTIYFNGNSSDLTNLTVVNNEGAGVFTTFNAFPSLTNSIVAGNAIGEFRLEIAGNGMTEVSWSLIEGPATALQIGPGVIDGDPQLDPSSDFRPSPGSPVIDAGNNAAVPQDVMLDLIGHPRFVDDPDTVDTGNGIAPIVDMGALEFIPPHSSRNPPPIGGQLPRPGSRLTTRGGR